jgi:hypothetical protein
MVAAMKPVQSNGGIPRRVIHAECALVIPPILPVNMIGWAVKQSRPAPNVVAPIVAVRKHTCPVRDTVGVASPPLVITMHHDRFT